MSKVKDRLLELEAEGKFLFHGSPILLEELDLKQPVNYEKRTGKEVLDGNLCVAATQFSKIAVFRALTHQSQFFGQKGCGSSFGLTLEGNIRLALTKKAWKQLEGKTGYVYVLDRTEFSIRSAWEWRSEHKVTPLEVIIVLVEDLAENIKIVSAPRFL